MAKRSKTIRSKRQNLQERKRRETRMRWIRIVGLFILVAAALGIFGFFRNSSAPSVDAPTEVMAGNILGPVDAPVRIVEFGDLGCPACRQWHNAGIKERLLAEFEGQISFTFRHFPVITRDSPQAAQAIQCAAEQDGFWQYHDYVYEQTPLAALSNSDLKGYALAIGLNGGEFGQCLDSGKYKDYVSRDQSAAVAAGARGTPAFYINGEIVSFSYEGMAAKIEQLLDS